MITFNSMSILVDFHERGEIFELFEMRTCIHLLEFLVIVGSLTVKSLELAGILQMLLKVLLTISLASMSLTASQNDR